MSAPELIAIDRSKWEMEFDGEDWEVSVDGHEAGSIWYDQDEGAYVWALADDASNPFDAEDSEPTEPTPLMAYAKIQEAWALYWGFCGTCGAETTKEDRRWLLASMDGIDAYCADCRAGNPDV